MVFAHRMGVIYFLNLLHRHIGFADLRPRSVHQRTSQSLWRSVPHHVGDHAMVANGRTLHTSTLGKTYHLSPRCWSGSICTRLPILPRNSVIHSRERSSSWTPKQIALSPTRSLDAVAHSLDARSLLGRRRFREAQNLETREKSAEASPSAPFSERRTGQWLVCRNDGCGYSATSDLIVNLLKQR